MKKILRITGFVLLCLLSLGIIYMEYSLPNLPAGTNAIIKRTRQSPLPELKGISGYAYNGATKIWYEDQQPLDSIKGSVLLIMGIANDALAWPDYFINPIVEEGYRVVRFDNRGTGMSDWLKEWKKEDAYTLEDMANDGIVVLDHLQIKKAHILGVSLGGMIAQTLVIHHPDRVNTLTSMMSTPDIMDDELPSINLGFVKDLMLGQIKYGMIKTESNEIKLQILSRLLLQGEANYPLDIEGIARSTLYNLRQRNGFNHHASRQQMEATILSGSRVDALKSITAPTLVIHGKSDPLIHVAHGTKTAELIPHAEWMLVEGMGHDIPEVFVEEVVGRILGFLGDT